MTDVAEQLRTWIWEQTERHDDDLIAAGPVFDLILNKIDEFREKAIVEPKWQTMAKAREAIACWHDQMAVDAASAPDGEAQFRFHECCAGLLRNDPRVAAFLALPAPPVGEGKTVLTKLTRAQRDFLELAVQSPTGNPWLKIGIRQRVGRAKNRMFYALKAKGFFDSANRITEAGRAALEAEGRK